jgi:Zn-dependent protease
VSRQDPRRVTRSGPLLLRVGRFYGVPLYFAPSWVIIATLITILYSTVLSSLVRGLGTGGSYGAAFGFAIATALCVLAHELGHTAVSLALRRPVRRVVIFLLGGVSEIEGEIDSARDELLIAVAGPAVSGLLAAVAAAGELFTRTGTLPAVLLELLFWSNVIIAVFNMLPGLPLDGGRVLHAVLWGITRSATIGTRIAAWIGRFIAVAIVVASSILVRQTDGGGIASWLISLLLAAFVMSGANRALQAARLRERIATVRLAELLRPGVLVHADLSVAEALRRARDCGARGIVIIDAAQRPQAIVEERRVRGVPPEWQPWTSIREVARAIEPGLVLPDSLDAADLLDALRDTPAGEYLVVHQDGSPAGILAAGDLAVALSGRRS